jgi:putative transposase
MQVTALRRSGGSWLVRGWPGAVTVERLMKRLGLRRVMRGKVVRTTNSNRKAPCPLDKVNRQYEAERPNQLWVSDFTYVSA